MFLENFAEFWEPLCRLILPPDLADASENFRIFRLQVQVFDLKKGKDFRARKVINKK